MSWKRGSILNRMVGKDLSTEMVFEWRPRRNEGIRLAETRGGRRVSGEEQSMHRLQGRCMPGVFQE